MPDKNSVDSGQSPEGLRQALFDRAEGSERVLARLDRQIALSKLALLWERLWPALIWPFFAIGFFLVFSWLGLWSFTDGALRFGVLCLAGVGLIASLVPLARLTMPTRGEALARLDDGKAILHRPAQALFDHLPDSQQDAVARRLWQAHLRREAERAAKLTVARPHPNLSGTDPFGLRSALLLLLVVGAVVAGPSAGERVIEAFSAGGQPVVPPRIDAWITPPAYTGRPTAFLSFDRQEAKKILRLPTGSILSVRSDRGEGVAVKVNGETVQGEEEAALGSEARLFRSTLSAESLIEVSRNGLNSIQWPVVIDPDLPPTIALDGEIQKTPSGALRLRYHASDDYGVAAAEAEWAAVRPASRARSLAFAAAPPPRPLVDPPQLTLVAPATRAKGAVITVTRDLTAHPWAGGLARLNLVARDDLGQEGRSQSVVVELPQRRFSNPLARVVVEQRRFLAQDANRRDQVELALDALTLDPENRVGDEKTYLTLRSLYHQLIQARDDDELRAVIGAMWEAAVLIEDGDLTPAERALRAAQQRLEQALERGATQDELRDIMRELRQAMQNVLRELAERALREQREGRQSPPPTGQERVISQQDIERLMREIENLVRQGRQDEARDLMAQLNQMLEALRNARPQFGNRQQGGNEQALQELGDIIREQQKLLDQTFRERQKRRQPGFQQGQRGQRRPGQRPQPGEGQQDQQQGQGDELGQDNDLSGLQESQQALRERLQRFLDQLREGSGREPGRQLNEADGQMGQAEGELGQGRPGEALGPQNRALDNLRRGGRQLAQELLGQNGQGDGPGPNGEPGGPQDRADGTQSGNDDPLHRGENDGEGLESNQTTRALGADRQRIQEILKDVRRRLADPNQPALEKDYLERLLRPF